MSDATNTVKKSAEPAYTPHPYALIFPPMEAGAFAALVADIKANGLREPITVNARNQILDGLNRYRACLQAGVEPRYERKDIGDEEVLAFILSRNVHRRHLATAQKAAAGAAAVKLSRNGPANLRISQAEAAKLFNVSERAVHEALQILEQSPELHEAAIAGLVSTHLSSQIAALPKPERDDALKKLKDGDKKAAKAIAKDATPDEVKKARAVKKTRSATSSAPTRSRPSRWKHEAPFNGHAARAPFFAELDLLSASLNTHPPTRSEAECMIAELRKVIERIEDAIKE